MSSGTPDSPGLFGAVNLPPALIFGAGLTGTGVVRSLGRVGIPTLVVCRPDEAVARSRYYHSAPLFYGRIPAPAELPEYLAALPIREAVLIPCSDDWTRAVAEIPESLKARFPASVAEAHVVRAFADKWEFARLIEQLELPHPQTRLIHSMEQLSSLEDNCYQGTFLKPINSQEFSVRNRVKAYQLQGKQHALDVMREAQKNGRVEFPILLQEYIPGPASRYFLVDGFVDRHGEVSALIARRRGRMYPANFGNSSFSTTIPLEEVEPAVHAIKKLLNRVRYRGIFDAEFKYDERDGQFKFIEVNARPWWFVEFATRCGVNLCRMAYLDSLGAPVEPVQRYDIGRSCFYLAADFNANSAVDPGVPGLFRWIKSIWGADEILYCGDDPGPGLASSWVSLKHRVRELLGFAPGESPHDESKTAV